MKKSSSDSPEVQDFIDGLQKSDENQYQIVQKCREIVSDINSDVEEEIKYGWILFLKDGELFWWVFSYKDHISFEFSKGVDFDDPEKILEWTGKFRRHLKIHGQDDIQDKNIEFFVKQALK